MSVFTGTRCGVPGTMGHTAAGGVVGAAGLVGIQTQNIQYSLLKMRGVLKSPRPSSGTSLKTQMVSHVLLI